MSVRAMKAGAVEFLTKPFRDQDLLDAIQRRWNVIALRVHNRRKPQNCENGIVRLHRVKLRSLLW